MVRLVKMAAEWGLVNRDMEMSHTNKAIDKVRAQETRELKARGKEPVLVTSRWCLVKKPENLTGKQVDKLRDRLTCNLKTIRSYLHKGDFLRFWCYVAPPAGQVFLDEWCTKAMRSRHKLIKKVAKMLRGIDRSCSIGFGPEAS